MPASPRAAGEAPGPHAVRTSFTITHFFYPRKSNIQQTSEKIYLIFGESG